MLKSTRFQLQKLGISDSETRAAQIPERDLLPFSQPKKWTKGPKFWLRKKGNTPEVWDLLNIKQKSFVRYEEEQEAEDRRQLREERKSKRARVHVEPSEPTEIVGSIEEEESAAATSPPLEPLRPLNLSRIPVLQDSNLSAPQPENLPQPVDATTPKRGAGRPFGSKSYAQRGTPLKNSAQVAKNLANKLPKIAADIELLNSESNLGPMMPGAAIMLLVVDQSNRMSWKGGQPRKITTMSVEEQHAQSEITIVAGGESQLMVCTDALCGAIVDHEERVAAASQGAVPGNTENSSPNASMWSENVNFLAGNSRDHFEQRRKARAVPRSRSLSEICEPFNHSGNNANGSMVVLRTM